MNFLSALTGVISHQQQNRLGIFRPDSLKNINDKLMVLLRIKAPHVADDQLILPDAQRLPHFLPDFRAVGILTGVDGVVQLDEAGFVLPAEQPVPGFLENPITVNTKDFFDIGLKAAYDFKLYKSMNLQINAGIQNIFNAYQDDFDKGADRDSGYIYGPSLPRSFFAGVKISY